MAVRSIAAPLNYNSLFLLEAHRQELAARTGGGRVIRRKKSWRVETYPLIPATTPPSTLHCNVSPIAGTATDFGGSFGGGEQVVRYWDGVATADKKKRVEARLSTEI
jgi:hypothetical protein